MKILENLWHGSVRPNEWKMPSNSEQYELVSLIVRRAISDAFGAGEGDI